MEYEIDLTPEDIGEIITIIRVQHIKMHVQPFAVKIGVKEKSLLIAEDGSGPHGLFMLKKINNAFYLVDITINVKFK
jgi:hypothetical protein